MDQDSELFKSELSVLEADYWKYGFTKGHLVPQGMTIYNSAEMFSD